VQRDTGGSEFPKRERQLGFTIVEAMIALAIVMVLTALAYPTFTLFVRRAKTGEATSNLNEMFQTAAALYARHTGAQGAEQGLGAQIVTNCIVPATPLSPATPKPYKQRFTGGGGFDMMQFTIADYVYFGYEIRSVGTSGGLTCGFPAGTQNLYTFVARADLDDDGILSSFELAAGSDPEDTLYHARGFHMENETE
jgi:type IV pilus assembly protein PilE